MLERAKAQIQAFRALAHEVKNVLVSFRPGEPKSNWQLKPVSGGKGKCANVRGGQVVPEINEATQVARCINPSAVTFPPIMSPRRIGGSRLA